MFLPEPSSTRRRALKLALLGLTALAHACGGGGGAPAAQSNEPAPQPPTPDWSPGPIVLLAGSADSIDLSLTLPSHIRRGGVFALDQRSEPLPTGMTLASNGMLSVGTAVAGVSLSIVFAYDEP
jgi:hypothetical protein